MRTRKIIRSTPSAVLRRVPCMLQLSPSQVPASPSQAFSLKTKSQAIRMNSSTSIPLSLFIEQLMTGLVKGLVKILGKGLVMDLTPTPEIHATDLCLC